MKYERDIMWLYWTNLHYKPHIERYVVCTYISVLARSKIDRINDLDISFRCWRFLSSSLWYTDNMTNDNDNYIVIKEARSFRLSGTLLVSVLISNEKGIQLNKTIPKVKWWNYSHLKCERIVCIMNLIHNVRRKL